MIINDRNTFHNINIKSFNMPNWLFKKYFIITFDIPPDVDSKATLDGVTEIL